MKPSSSPAATALGVLLLRRSAATPAALKGERETEEMVEIEEGGEMDGDLRQGASTGIRRGVAAWESSEAAAWESGEAATMGAAVLLWRRKRDRGVGWAVCARGSWGWLGLTGACDAWWGLLPRHVIDPGDVGSSQ